MAQMGPIRDGRLPRLYWNFCHFSGESVVFPWCRLSDSNRRPTAYKAVALPTELSRRWALCPLLQMMPNVQPSVRASVSVSGAGDQGANSPAIARSQAAVSSKSEEHTSELQSLMRISYAVFCLKKKQL